MKILFITYELPPVGGGGGRAAWQIARRLVPRGHEVRILSSLLAGLPPLEERDGVRIHRIRVRRETRDRCTALELLSFMLRSIPAASRLAEEFEPSVVCAFFGIPGGPAAWRLRRSRGVPYVLALRGSDVPRPEIASHQRLHLLTRPLLRRIYRGAAAIVAVSEPLRRAALAVAPDVAVGVIPNGVDIERFRPSGEKVLPAGGVELLFVGRLQEFKRVQDAIRALPGIAGPLGRPVRLIVAGDGPFRQALESLAQQIRSSGPGVDVKFTGWLDEDALRLAYDTASVLVLPSLVEGHPNVVLEGMAMGLPCIGADVPGIREAIEDGRDGLLVPPKDPQAIARAAEEILSDAEKWRMMSRSALARAREFSWDKIAAEYEAVFARAERAGPDFFGAGQR